MKRFLVFGFDNYYPSGGIGDLQGEFDTLEEAIALTEVKNRYRPETYEWENYELVDTQENTVTTMYRRGMSDERTKEVTGL